jgi:glycosyltransferase involved in cell wall biosynthesis
MGKMLFYGCVQMDLMQKDAIHMSGGKRLKGLSTPNGLDGPLITVITPVFNGDQELEASILSVLNQEYRNMEYILIDGGSTDRTLDIFRKYEDSIDYWISEPDRGIYDAMNKAVDLARGQWLYFIGSDDTLRDSLKGIAQYLVDERTIYYGNVFYTGSRTLYDGPFGPRKLSRCNICQQAIFYPRRLFESQRFKLQYPVAADWEFNLRSYSNPHFRFQYIPVLVANYNDLGGVSAVGPTDERFEHDMSNLIREYLPTIYYILFLIERFARAVVYGGKRRRRTVPRT